jgi:glycosyltransferase involved in cell wall biosynthesis
MHKKLVLAWCALVAVVAYPLGVFAISQMPETIVTTARIEPGLWLSFTLALLIGLVLLPRQLLSFADRRNSVLAVVTWVLAGGGVWACYRYFTATPTAADATALWATAGAQGVLGLAGTVVLRRLWLVATAACLLLFIPAFPLATNDGGLALAAGLAAVLFVVAAATAHRVVMARHHFDGYSLILHALKALQWTLATAAGWILALFLVGIADRVPTWLPIATALVQAGIAIGLPILYLAMRGRLSFARFFYTRPAAEAALADDAVIHGTADGVRTAWIISYTGVSNEPRVRRQADALLGDGWRVVVCGFDGHTRRPEEWTYIRLPETDVLAPKMRMILQLLRGVGAVAAAYLKPAIVARCGALLSHSCTAHWLTIRQHLLHIAREHPELKPDLVIAHDYFTGDVGYALAHQSQARLSIDCHEYAVEQSSHDPRWVRWHQPCVRFVEDYYLRRADLVTTVCDGIADLLNAEHRLRRRVLVVRSVPLCQPQPFRPTGERIRVLYHGAIWHVRQLHVAIESMHLWRPEFDLVLRGDGDPAYIAELRRLIGRYGLEDRVFFEPAVPFDRIVPEANRADIGYLSYHNFSRQIEFALPNKFFEYVMAGLALCVSGFTEMGRLTRRYELGKLIPQHDPQAIAETINSFTRDEIDRCKKASVEAAKELNWDHEKRGLLAAYDELCARPMQAVQTAAGSQNAPLSSTALAT